MKQLELDFDDSISLLGKGTKTPHSLIHKAYIQALDETEEFLFEKYGVGIPDEIFSTLLLRLSKIRNNRFKTAYLDNFFNREQRVLEFELAEFNRAQFKKKSLFQELGIEE